GFDWRSKPSQVLHNRQTSLQHLYKGNRKIGIHSDPMYVRAGVDLRDLFTTGGEPLQIGKINSRARTNRVPAPNSRVQIDHFETSVTSVTLELDFNQPTVLQRL